MRSLCILIFCAFFSGYECGGPELCNYAAPYVKTNTGSVVGKYVKVRDTRVAAFLGIPYANPPIGEKRFMKPEPVAAWDGILQTTKKPPPCMQYSTKNFIWIPTSKPSENCLFLNVWVPTRSSCDALDKLPVLVWIHGGGFFAGSSEMDIYDGSILASSGNVIVVSMNYRLGIFGFINFNINDANGNMGMYDQVLALRWVRANIGHFGGDERGITVFGESAGSMSTGMHILSPMTKNLFRRVIMQSGSPNVPSFLDNIEVAISKGISFANSVGCTGANENDQTNASQLVECLKKKNAMDLALAESALTSDMSTLFVPTFGSEFMPRSLSEMLNSRDFNQVDILIGANNDEGSTILCHVMPGVFHPDQTPKLNLTTAEMIIHKTFEKIPNLPQKVYEFYFGNLTNEDTKAIVQNLSNAFGDFIIVCPTVYFAGKMKKVYMYWMNHRSLRNPNAEWVGVAHFDEVPYVFGQPILDSYNYTPEDSKFSESLIQKWITFVKHGYPLQKGDKRSWSRFSEAHLFAFELNAKNEKEKLYPRLAACEFWKPYFISNFS